MGKWELTVEQLRFYCEERLLPFSTTEEVQPLEVMIGQERAVKAVEFGLFSNKPGYNIFMSGQVGTGKITYAKDSVKRIAKTRPIPRDWCYVNNFDLVSQPLAISLPAGMGTMFRQDMEELVEAMKNKIPKVFSSDNYEQARSALAKKFQESRNVMIEMFNQDAERTEILPQWSSTGFVGVPMKDGKPLQPDEYNRLDKQEKEAIDKKMLELHEKAMEVINKIQQLEREVREDLKELDGKVGLFAAGYLIEELKLKYQDFDGVVEYLEAVQQDVVNHISDFKPEAADEDQNPFAMFRKTSKDVKDKYKVNVFVDNKQTDGAPIVIEINPTYYNLVGRVEYQTRMGVLHTDYTMIKPGAIHKANGGYLILNARDVLTNIGAWEALKRVLKTKCLTIENLGEQYGMLAMATLKPQKIPVDIKVILIGNPMIYQLLYTYDEDFRKLFKVHADFDVQMDNNLTNLEKLAGFISSTVQREGLKHFDRSAVAQVVEYSSRLANSQKKLTTQFNEVVELLSEADVWATIGASEIVTAEHIKKAIVEKRYRSNKYEEYLQEMFADGKLLMDTENEAVGQVNGLAVMSVGEYAFGKPSRITANTFLGKSGVVNIERETKMSGTSHSKGVLTLSGYLGEKYAQDAPLALSASITFEQLYSGVDGDSASSTELYAILSSLSEIPLKQHIAVTGSVNQKGEVQPIGGATEKIEGFFAVCKLKGLTGKQGVMIPYQNIDNLTLNDEVIAAVKNGQFHIYAVKTIDDGLEILTGHTAEEIHDKVRQKLKHFTDTIVKLGKSAEAGQKENA